MMLLLLMLIGVPVFWMVSGSLKTTQEIQAIPIKWLPTSLQWENFREAWNAAPFGRFYLNTIITTAFGSGLELLNATFTAYALAFLRFPRKTLVFVLILIALMIPDEVVVLPNYLTVAGIPFFGWNWINTYQGIIIPGASVAFGAFFLRQAFLGLPREVLDAARVDGCGHVRMLWDMVVPMARPSILTFGLISLVAKWNEYLWPLVVTNEDRMRTLTVGLTYLFDSEGNTEWGVVMAGTVFVLAPLIIIFIWAQRFIIEGITSGATKG
ncbi:MAG: carbohydrate ABC transporter permease [Thermomicrobiales bacterium]|nr:carbohydrate ABC transporter permease [Thermomicrobiales bacterium]